MESSGVQGYTLKDLQFIVAFSEVVRLDHTPHVPL